MLRKIVQKPAYSTVSNVPRSPFTTTDTAGAFSFFSFLGCTTTAALVSDCFDLEPALPRGARNGRGDLVVVGLCVEGAVL